MKRIFIIIIMGIILGVAGTTARDYRGNLEIANSVFREVNDTLFISFDVRIHSDMIKSCQSLLLFPEVQTDQESLRFPYLQLNGLNRGHMIRRSHTLKGVNPKHEKPYLKIEIDPKTDCLVHYEFHSPYELWMDSARLILKQEVWDCAGEKRLYAYCLNQKVDLTIPESTPFTPVVNYIQPEQEIKNRTLHMKSYLHFHVNQSVIVPELKNNRTELDKIDDGIGKVKNHRDITIQQVSIVGYASPEGSYASNDRLSYNRARALKEYIQQKFTISNQIMRISNIPEDWAGLREMVATSRIVGKDHILSIIDSDIDYDQKDMRLKSLVTTYQVLLRDFYPSLRRVECNVDYFIKDYTLEEATILASNEPELLSQYELFKVASQYDRSTAEFQKILSTILRLYPDDPVACGNYGAILLENNEPTMAKHYLDKANSAPFIYNNLGVYYLIVGDYEKAEQLFYQAKDTGVREAEENLKIVEKKKEEEKSRQRFAN